MEEQQQHTEVNEQHTEVDEQHTANAGSKGKKEGRMNKGNGGLGANCVLMRGQELKNNELTKPFIHSYLQG